MNTTTGSFKPASLNSGGRFFRFDPIFWLESYLYKYRYIAWTLVAIAALGVPSLGFSMFMMRIFTMIGVFAMLALGLNILTGYAGQVSLGHAGFFAIGGYTSALLMMNFGLGFFPAMALAGLVAAACGLLLGLPTLRLSGPYLTIITLGFGEITRIIIINWASVTNGTLGLRGIPMPQVLGHTLTLGNNGLYYLMLAMLLFTSLACYAIANSRIGRAFLAIKEDPIAATMMGIRTTHFKVLAFMLSAFIAGITGAFYAPLLGFIDHNTFDFDMSILILSIVIVGGMGTLRGMFIGSAILIAFPEASRALMDYRFVVYGLLLVLMMRFRPQGLLGWKSRMPYKLPKLARKEIEAEASK